MAGVCPRFINDSFSRIASLSQRRRKFSSTGSATDLAKCPTTPPPALPSKATFTSLKGATFRVTSNTTTQAMTLVSISDIPAPATPDLSQFAVMPPTASAVQPAGFSLEFYGGTKKLQQGTYTFENSQTGKFSIFIVPCSRKRRPVTKRSRLKRRSLWLVQKLGMGCAPF